jgi:hypothetical protein
VGSKVLRNLLGWLLGLTLLVGRPVRAEELQPEPGPLHLHVELHDVEPERSKPLEKLARQAVNQVQEDLMTGLSGDLHIDFVGSPAAFKHVIESHGASGWPENWIAGLALLDQDRVVVQVNGPGALLTSEVVRHELAHVALHALSGGTGLPRWYHEGVAMYLAGETTYERLKEQSGASAFGELDSLAQLNHGFGNENQVAAERAYAVSAGFVRFAVLRAGDRRSILLLHARMRAGLDFPTAYTATFGMSPDSLYSLYGAHIGQHASRWTMLLTDSTLWALVSVLALLAMSMAWKNRARFEPDGEPLDLEAIAAEGELALRPWKRRDFSQQPLVVTREGREPALELDLPLDEPLDPRIDGHTIH